MIYALRVVVPDSPGSLGAVATAIGAVGGDILSLDVVERGADGAVDDLLVDLPPPALADTLVGAVLGVAGVTLEAFRPYLGDRDVTRDLELVERVATAPATALETLAALAPGAFRSAWALVVEARPGHPPAVLAQSDAAPDTVLLGLPWLPLPVARRLDEDPRWVPAAWRALGTELVAAPVGRPGLALLVGRAGGPAFRDGEVARLAHLASITATVLRSAARGCRAG